MTTPLVTVANSIIEFILSLLRDPAALAELEKDPEAALVKNKVAGICAEDVRAVAPIIYDRSDVVPRASSTTTPAPPSNHNDVVNEITRITNNWTTIDSRSTIVDQSVNQNIWTEGGDVTQIFDQSAGVASGDGSMAGGDDVNIGPLPGDDEDDTPTLDDLPGVPDEVGDVVGDVIGGLDEPGADDTEPADGEEPPAADEPDAQLAAAEQAGVPQEAVAAVDAAAPGAEQPPAAPAPEAPISVAPVAEVDDTVWSEPVDTVEVEEVVYPDEFGEEQ